MSFFSAQRHAVIINSAIKIKKEKKPKRNRKVIIMAVKVGRAKRGTPLKIGPLGYLIFSQLRCMINGRWRCPFRNSDIIYSSSMASVPYKYLSFFY